MAGRIRIVVAGGRDFSDYNLLEKSLDHLLSKTEEEIEIVSGTARGADKLGEKYAEEKGLEIKRFPADWDKYGKSAGYKRNKQMAEYASHAVIFWDGKSKGSKHMIDLCKEYGLNLRVIRYE